MEKKLSEYERKLEKLRLEINKHDRELLGVLKKRFMIVKKIAKLKAQYKISILQKKRWKSIIEDRVRLGKKLRLDEKFTKKIMHLIHNESIRTQLHIKNKTRK